MNKVIAEVSMLKERSKQFGIMGQWPLPVTAALLLAFVVVACGAPAAPAASPSQVEVTGK